MINDYDNININNNRKKWLNQCGINNNNNNKDLRKCLMNKKFQSFFFILSIDELNRIIVWSIYS